MDAASPLTLEKTSRGVVVLFSGRRLYTPGNPQGGALKRVQRFKEQFDTTREDTLYLIPSPLLLYGIPELMKAAPTSARFLLMEQEPALYALTVEALEKSGLDPNRIYLAGPDELSAPPAVMAAPEWSNIRRTVTVPLTGGYALHAETYRALQNELRAFLENRWKNRMTFIHMGPLWFRNIFLNLPHLPQARRWLPSCGSQPLFVAGAGESLEDALPFLRRNRDALLLLAVDTALPVLWDADLVPDFIFVMESQHVNLYDFYNHPATDIPVICDLSSAPVLLRKIRGPIHLYYSRFYATKLWERLDNQGLLPFPMAPMGSVGNGALWSAFQMTRGALFFAGLDFAYPPGKPHARSSPSLRLSHSASTRLNPVGFFHEFFRKPHHKKRGKDGSATYTNLIMEQYSRRMDELLDGRVVYDLGARGLPNRAQQLHLWDAEKVLAQSRPLLSPDSEASFPRAQPAADDVSAFLKSELDLNRILQERVSLHLRQGLPESAWPELKGKLEELDYLYLPFPDRQPILKNEAGLLKRVVFESRRISAFLQKAVSSVIACF